MGKRGQAASEYLGIIIIVLIILIPILILYIRYSGETKDAVVSSKVDSITNEITRATNQVFVYGPGTQSTVTISFPENIDYVEFSNKDVTFHLINSKGQPYKLAKVTDTNFRPGIFYDLPSGKINLKFKTCDEGAVEVCLANTNQCTTRCTTTQNLVLNYNFNSADGGATVKDSSSYKNDGTLNSAIQPQTSGCINGYCYNFNNNNINVPDSSSLSIIGDLTLSLWVKPNPLSGTQYLIAKNQGSNAREYELRINPTGTLSIFRGTGGSESSVTSSSSVLANSWSNVVVTISGNSATFYINGVSAGTGSLTVTPIDSSDSLKIGSKNSGNYYNGLIDEVRIYNYALSQQDIQNYYNINKP